MSRQQWALSVGCGFLCSLALVLLAWVMTSQPPHARRTTIRVGYFPNATHVHALVVQNMQRHGRNWFAESLGPEVQVDWQSYNAGPSAMRAMFTKSIDLTYVGPGPVLDAYTRSRGESIRILAGAVYGGSALVVQSNSKLTKPSDFRGKRVAVPEFENTQDIAARAWLAAGGVRVDPSGGEVELIQLPILSSSRAFS
jgi:NitT/TauT family transport system substrate-binding protein